MSVTLSLFVSGYISYSSLLDGSHPMVLSSTVDASTQSASKASLLIFNRRMSLLLSFSFSFSHFWLGRRAEYSRKR